MTKIDAAKLRALYLLARDAFLQFPGTETARFAARLPADPGPAQDSAPSWKTGASHLVEARPKSEFHPFVSMLTDVSRLLTWRNNYTAKDVGPSYAESSCFTELLSPRGHFAGDDICFGVGVMGPECFYPDHRHEAEEVYAPVAGQGEWRYDMGRWETHRAGEAVHTTSQAWHAVRTRSSTMVILYTWMGGDLAQKSEIAPNARLR